MNKTTQSSGSKEAAGFQTLDRHQTPIHEYDVYIPKYGYNDNAREVAALAGYKYFIQQKNLRITSSDAPVKNHHGRTLTLYDLTKAQEPTPPPNPNRERSYPNYKATDWKERVRRFVTQEVGPHIVGIPPREIGIEIHHKDGLEIRFNRTTQTHGIPSHHHLVVINFRTPEYAPWGCSPKYRPIQWEPGEVYASWENPEVLEHICQTCKNLIKPSTTLGASPEA